MANLTAETEKPKMRLDDLTKDERKRILTAVKEAGGVVAYANLHGLNRGLVSMAVNNRYLSPRIATLFNIQTTAPAPICINPDCKGYGKPHTFDCQTEQVRPIETKPTRKGKGKPRQEPPYFKCRRDNPEQAARQVEKYLPGYKLVKER